MNSDARGGSAARRTPSAKGKRTSTPKTHSSPAMLTQVAHRLLSGLNAEQAAAAGAPPGPVLVLAGAGSGKTRVLVTRIIHLIATGTALPSEIVALTFSNRAAKEMQGRLKAYAGSAVDGVSLSTFHSLGLRMVRSNAPALGLAPDPAILDMHSRLSLMVTQAGKHGARNKKFDAFDLSNTLSQLKEKGFTPEDCPVDTEYGTRLPRIYKGYEKAKLAGNFVDFEDLIRMPIRLLRDNPKTAAEYRKSWRHFLVDEFQDTNGAQLELIRLLVGEVGMDHSASAETAGSVGATGSVVTTGTVETMGRVETMGSVFVVGDDDQSIYGWRGAEMRNLLDFETHFRGARVVKLQENYRSTSTIIGASNAVIHKNTLRRPKEVFTARDAGEPLYHHVADDEKSEKDWLVAKVKELNRTDNLDWREMAVLVRTNIQLREFMEEFIMGGVPFAVKGADNLLEWPEVQVALAYAKLMANLHDELSLSKVLAFPKRGFSKNLLEVMPRSEAPAIECLREYCVGVGQAWTTGVLQLLDQVEARSRESRAGNFFAPLEALLSEAGVTAAFEAGSRKRGRYDEFLRLFAREEQRNPEARLPEVLNALALDTQNDNDPENKPGVKLMTVHASKGLEFHTVFMPQLDDDTFPSKPNHTDTGIEEERRLFYVAMTRAKRRLFLSWPATKVHYRVVRDVIPSRFIFEIPEDRWDGPLGKKNEVEKKEFLDGFFASLRANFNDEQV